MGDRPLELITASRLKDARACIRLHYYRYVALRRPRVVPRALAFGIVLHSGLAGWWRAIRDGYDPLTMAIADITLSFGDLVGASLDQADLDEMHLSIIEELMIGYHARWREGAADYDVLHVEERFEGPLVNPATGRRSQSYQQGGKLDLVLRRRSTRRVWLVEHKSSSENITPGSTYWNKLKMDPQISLYYAGARALTGEDPEGCLYDVISKPTMRLLRATPEADRKFTQGKKCKVCDGRGGIPKVGADAKAHGSVVDVSVTETLIPCMACESSGWVERPRLYANQRAEDETMADFRVRLAADIAEHPDEYYARGEVVRVGNELAESAADVWMQARLIHEARIGGRYPRNPDACFRMGGECPYWGVCTGSADLADEIKFRDSSKHEELEPEKTVEQRLSGFDPGEDMPSPSGPEREGSE